MTAQSVIATRVAERMRAVGTNQRRLSLSVGSPDIVRMILNGRSQQPRANTMVALARELRCDVRYLLGETDSPGEGSSPPAQAPDANAIALEVQPDGSARLRVDKVLPFALAAEIIRLIASAEIEAA